MEYNKGDVICTNEFSMIKSKNITNLYCVEDAPLMDYYKVKQNDEHKYFLHYKNDVIMEEIESIENNIDKDSPNRLGVIFGTQESKTISKTLWCLMTKTLPGHVQPPHRHNSIALDYCVNGEGYTLFSKTINEDGSLHDPIKIFWNQGMVFVTPPGWWHSHHSTDNKPGYIFPVQDAGLHMYMDTLDIQFG
jgi:gentisate 1,2-dioxygenase